MRVHPGGLKRPITGVKGESLSLVGIMTATSLLMPTGPETVTEAPGLCLGVLGSPTLLS